VELILPPGYDYPGRDETADMGRGVIVNESGLPDQAVYEGVQTYFEEHASVLGVSGATQFGMYANTTGSILARGRFQTPRNITEEIILARDLAERDDDIASTMGAMLACAFGDGMQNNHEDEVTIALFNEIAKAANLDGTFEEIYREFLIAGQFTTATMFQSKEVTYKPVDADRARTRTIRAPRIGVIPAENVLPIGNDMFGTAPLYYRPRTGAQEEWLREFFSPSTSPGRKAEMRRQDPVLTTMLVEERQLSDPALRVNSLYEADNPNPASGEWVYRLNPTIVARTTMPKGAWPQPRPLMTRNFPLLEAKRLLNLMDYALLEGGANFLVVAKKGTDQRPALPPEVANLHDVIKRAARSGVIIGDHRLSIEIITPDLTELLNESKRGLIARKLSKALMRLPDYGSDSGSSGQGVLADTEVITRVIASDRRKIKRHIENNVYDEAANRNDPIAGPASIWFPKIMLQGSQWFTDFVLKLRDRGDISRKTAIEAGGFAFEAEVQQRKREKSSGVDRALTPAAVPFTNPGAGPQDNNAGRPRGTSPNNGAPNAQRRPGGGGGTTRTIARNSGETVTSMYDEELGAYYGGEITVAILDEYADAAQFGRVTRSERDAIARIEGGEQATFQEGPLTVVPVNCAYEVGDLRALRLAEGLGLLVGRRPDDNAVVARAVVGRSTEFDELAMENLVTKWGFTPPEPEQLQLMPVVDEPGGKVIGHTLARVEA
jgi:hypothetical protein